MVNTLTKEIPTYIFRYEDLISDPEPMMLECFRFLLDVHSIEGTIVEARIKEISRQGNESKAIYNLQNTKCTDMYSHMYSEQ